MMRGLEVSTTSPRLASTSMFWIMFSSIASCRLRKAGSLGGGEGVALVSKVTDLQAAAPLSCVQVQPAVGSAQISIESPTPSPNIVGHPVTMSQMLGVWLIFKPGLCHRRARFGGQ